MTSKTEIEYDLQKTSDILILNGTLTESPGLIHGKTYSHDFIPGIFVGV